MNANQVPPPEETIEVYNTGLPAGQSPGWRSITLHTADEPTQADAAVYGPFAVHVHGITWAIKDERTLGYRFDFNVTHVPTGMAMFRNLTNLEAHQIAVELWSDTELTATFEAEKPDFSTWTPLTVERFRSISCHAAHDFGLLFGDEDGDA